MTLFNKGRNTSSISYISHKSGLWYERGKEPEKKPEKKAVRIIKAGFGILKNKIERINLKKIGASISNSMPDTLKSGKGAGIMAEQKAIEQPSVEQKAVEQPAAVQAAVQVPEQKIEQIPEQIISQPTGNSWKIAKIGGRMARKINEILNYEIIKSSRKAEQEVPQGNMEIALSEYASMKRTIKNLSYATAIAVTLATAAIYWAGSKEDNNKTIPGLVQLVRQKEQTILELNTKVQEMEAKMKLKDEEAQQKIQLAQRNESLVQTQMQLKEAELRKSKKGWLRRLIGF